jgi:hypothetical protein
VSEIVFLRDDEWSVIDGCECLVKEFRPMAATVEDGKVVAPSRRLPYAAVDFVCAEFEGDATGFITHRDDFRHLWTAVNDRGIGDDEELIIIWTRQYPSWWARRTSKALPKLVVWVCPSGAYELMTDPGARPELAGEERFQALRPIAEWKPDVLS